MKWNEPRMYLYYNDYTPGLLQTYFQPTPQEESVYFCSFWQWTATLLIIIEHSTHKESTKLYITNPVNYLPLCMKTLQNRLWWGNGGLTVSCLQ